MSPALLSGDNLKYTEIADELRRDIQSGVLRPGDRLPTFVESRERFGTTSSTLDRAHAVLEREGLIVRGQGRRGTKVVEQAASPLRYVIGCEGFDFHKETALPYWMHLLAGVQQVAKAGGYRLLMMEQSADIRREQMDAVLLHGEHTDAYLNALPKGMPVVSMMLPTDGMPSVISDDSEGARRATEHLLQLGHRRIGTLMIIDTPLPKRRLAGYRAALHEAGITPDARWIRPLRPSHLIGTGRKNGRHAMAEWLSSDWKANGLTAVLAQNDEIAIGIMDALQEAGLRVPEDVSVIGFDGTEEGEHSTPQLTSVAVPLEKIGAIAMELLLRQLRGEHVEPNITTLPVRLHVRQSTAGAPTGTSRQFI